MSKIAAINNAGNESDGEAFSDALGEYLSDILFEGVSEEGFDLGPDIIVGSGGSSGSTGDGPATDLPSPDDNSKLREDFGIQNPTASIVEMWRSYAQESGTPGTDSYQQAVQLRAFMWGLMADGYISGTDLGGRLEGWKATRDAEMKEWALNSLRAKIPEMVAQIEANDSYTLDTFESVQLAYVTGEGKIGDRNLIVITGPDGLPIQNGPIINRQDLVKILGFNPFPAPQ
jgi:hypothetical protein